MPKATPGSRSARLQTPGAEGVEEGAVLERKTAGEVALEAVTELGSNVSSRSGTSRPSTAHMTTSSSVGSTLAVTPAYM